MPAESARNDFPVDEWKVFQSYHTYWYTKVMRGPHHVKTIVTFTQWGGSRQARRLIRKRKRNA